MEIGSIPPDRKFVNKYFNASSGTGLGEGGSHGPWNRGSRWEYVESPVQATVGKAKDGPWLGRK